MTEGIQDQNVIAVGKHFAAFSLDANPGTKTNVEVSEQALHDTYLPGFKTAVLEGGLLVLDELEKVRVQSNQSALEIAEKGGGLLKNEGADGKIRSGDK